VKFLPAVDEEILIQNILTKCGCWLNIFVSCDVLLCWRHNVSWVQAYLS